MRDLSMPHVIDVLQKSWLLREGIDCLNRLFDVWPPTKHNASTSLTGFLGSIGSWIED